MHWQRWELLTRPKFAGGMGFRDLRMFNLAMLGKQGWRLINTPDSLCARVLKGRYYHDSNFLAATRRKHASQTWRAILAGRDVLQKGIVRRIGDGQTTNIWHDRWIPNHFDGTPLVVPDDPQLTTVSELITPSGAWNEEMIKHTFADIDAHAILSTPIRGTGQDIWGWEPEKHGCYSVRSAYRIVYNEHWQQAEQGRASASGDISWRRIWRLCVPLKVRVFWWRVINGFLPAKGVLNKRHIEPVPNCDVCGADEESIKHVLMDCTVARCFWEHTQGLTGAKLPRLHPHTWARDLIDPKCCSEKTAAIFLCGMWSLWMARNKRRHGELEVPMRRAVEWAKDTAFDLWQISHPIKGKGDSKGPMLWQ